MDSPRPLPRSARLCLAVIAVLAAACWLAQEGPRDLPVIEAVTAAHNEAEAPRAGA